MRILTNYERFPASWELPGGLGGTTRIICKVGDFLRHLRECDLILVNNDSGMALRFGVLFTVLPWLKKPLVAVDLVLRRPTNEVVRRLKRFLFSRVDYFIHYFKDVTGYQRYYGIGPDRSGYVPFKPNIRYRFDAPVNPDGDYILCFGKSQRDYDTFFDAVAQLPYPAAIPRPDFAQLRMHGSRFSRGLLELPANVRILDDDGSSETMVRVLSGARLVALSVLKTSICASGIGTYLNAMLLGKCVIVSEGVGASDVLTDQALFVPPEDPPALAAMIRRAWEDDALRRSTAARGCQYATSLGGEQDLYRNILNHLGPFMSRLSKA